MASFRRLYVEVVGNASSFVTMMNRMSGGVTHFQRNLGSANRQMQQSNRYLMAIGTTARYALAGRLVFGVVQAEARLRDFKAQLGTIDALAANMNSRGRFTGLGDQLNDVGRDALLLSNQLGIATSDVEDYMQRFFSAFNPPAGIRVQEMQSFVRTVGEMAAVLGSEAGDPSQVAGALASFANAIPGGRVHPGRTASNIGSAIMELLRTTPNLTGKDVAAMAGRLASVLGIARMNPEQAFGVLGVAAQTGGSSAVIIRGIAQLLSASLLHPTTPKQLGAFQAAGLPTDPTTLRNMGGLRVLETLMNFVAPQGVHATRNQLRTLNRGAPAAGLAASGLGNQINITALYNLFGRQESVRQFINLLSQGGTRAVERFIGSLHKAERDNLLQQMYARAARQRTLTRFQYAGQNLGTAVLWGADWPLENLVARPTIAASNFAIRHRTATQGIVGGALALGAANAMRKLGVFGRFGGAIGRAGALQQAAIAQAVSKEELPAAIAGGAADGSRANPFWVIISPLSWAMGGTGMGGGGDGKGGRRLPPIFGRLSKGAMLAGGLAAVDAAAILSSRGSQGSRRFNMHGDWGTMHMSESASAQGLSHQFADALLAAERFAHLRGRDIQHIEFRGKADADLQIRLVDKNGREVLVQEKKGVPINIFPVTQGKPGQRKAGRHRG